MKALLIVNAILLLLGISLIISSFFFHSTTTSKPKNIKKMPSKPYIPAPLFPPKGEKTNTKWKDCVNIKDSKYSLLWDSEKDPICSSELIYYNRNLKITDIGTCEFGRKSQGKKSWENPWNLKMCTRKSECNVHRISDTDFAKWTPGEGTECIREIEEN